MRLTVFALLLTAFTIPALASEPLVTPVIPPGAAAERVLGDMKMTDGGSWDGTLFWFPDTRLRVLFVYDPTDRTCVPALENTPVVTAVFCDAHGNVFLCDNSDGSICRLDHRKLVPVFRHEGTPTRKPNDLAVDHRGGIYHTVTSTNEIWYTPPLPPTGPDNKRGESRVVSTRVPKPNGITLSPDGRTLYTSAFLEKKIYAFTIGDDGSLSDGRVLASMDGGGPERGADGMTVDNRGDIYCCGPHAVWVWNPAGKLLGKIPVPEKPVNCRFGGGFYDPTMNLLYISAGGSLYSIKLNAVGVR